MDKTWEINLPYSYQSVMKGQSEEMDKIQKIYLMYSDRFMIKGSKNVW